MRQVAHPAHLSARVQPSVDPLKRIDHEALLRLPCDILIPAALQNQRRADNTADVKARIVVEAANGPTTPAADRILFDKGIPVLPDILANAGGVTVSCYERVADVVLKRGIWP